MTPERWQRVNDVFLAAVETPANRRSAFLNETCASDPSLREEVEYLLAHDQTGEVDSFLDSPPHPFPPRSSTAPDPLLGQAIGPYQILHVLGEGGMGVVYLAQQQGPIRREVALKLIKVGMDTREVVARFDSERQALAMLNHPNVAAVHDGGATELGRSYFVMEHVPGVPITQYSDDHRLTTRERLQLFLHVCDAVQHAHQKGVIHRDLKPSNVLVTVRDGTPVPKVIDFGIAKAMNQRLTERTSFTAEGGHIGTPAYMSPEQVGMTPDIDTRTDVYSLGVLLYELLVGVTPFDPKTLMQAGYAEMERIIREIEPPKPSTRFGTLGEALGITSQRRRSDARSLRRQLHGDLDWITIKALQKDRARRYATATDLAADLDRHLNHEPVLAGPPSAGYRVRKFIRRHKVPVAAAVTVVLALSAGVVSSTLLYVRAEDQRRRAVEAEQEEARERTQAEAAQDEAEAVTEFLSEMLASPDPAKKGKDITVGEILDVASRTVGEKFVANPLIEARLRGTLGWTYFSLGLYEPAEAHLSSAACTYSRLLGDKHPKALATLNRLAAVMGFRGNYSANEAKLRSVVEVARHVLGVEHHETLASMTHLANTLLDQGRFAEAEEWYQKTLEVRHRVQGDEHPETLNVMNNLANALLDQGRIAEAEEWYQKTLEVRRRILGEEHPDTLISMHNLAAALRRRGRFAEAEELYRKTLDGRRRVLGEEHPRTLLSTNNLANTLCDQGRFAEAEELYRKTLDGQRRVLGEAHLQTLGSMNNLAATLNDQGRLAEAEKLHRHTLEVRRRVLGEEHPHVAESLVGLASVLEKSRCYNEAEELCRQARASLDRRFPPGHRDRHMNENLLGAILVGQGRFAEAETLLLNSYEALKNAGIPSHERKAMIGHVVRLYESWDAAEPDQGHAAKAAQWRAKLAEVN